MIFSPAPEAREALAQDVDKVLRAIPGDGETRAVLRTLGSEGCHDHESIRGEAGAEHADVSLPLLRLDEEVEEGAVVPEAVCPGRLPLQEVRTQPLNPGRRLTKAGLRALQRPGRHIQHRDIGESSLDQFVDEPGRTAPHVDDRCVLRDAMRLDQFDRHPGLRLIPAPAPRAHPLVHRFPVLDEIDLGSSGHDKVHYSTNYWRRRGVGRFPPVR